MEQIAENKGIIKGIVISFILVTACFGITILSLYFFVDSVSLKFSQFINSLPLSHVLSYGGIATVLFYISKKYKGVKKE